MAAIDNNIACKNFVENIGTDLNEQFQNSCFEINSLTLAEKESKWK